MDAQQDKPSWSASISKQLVYAASLGAFGAVGLMFAKILTIAGCIVLPVLIVAGIVQNRRQARQQAPRP